MSTGDIGGIRAGKAYVQFGLNQKEFDKQMQGASRSLRRFARETSRVGRSMTAIGGLGTAAWAGLIKQAANAEQATRRFGLVFGKQTAEMTKSLQRLSESTGAPMAMLQRQGGMFAGLFGDLKGTRQYVKVIEQVQRATLNLSTVTGSFAEAQDRMMSILTGSTEVGERFGIETKVSALNMEAQRLGINKTVDQMTELEKKLVRLSVTQRALNTQGVEFAKMSGLTNVQLSLLWENVQSFGAELGKLSNAYIGPLLRQLNDFISDNRNLAAGMSQMVFVAGTASAAYLGLGLALNGVAWSANAAAAGFVKLAAAKKLAMGAMGPAGLAAVLGGTAIGLATPGGQRGVYRALGAYGDWMSGLMSRMGNERMAGRYATFAEVSRAMGQPPTDESTTPGDEGNSAQDFLDAMPDIQQSIAEARGSFQSRMIEQQFAYGMQATPTEQMKDMLQEFLDRVVGDDAVRVQMEAQ